MSRSYITTKISQYVFSGAMFVALILMTSRVIHAERYALLIGTDYSDCRIVPADTGRCPPRLYGPLYDVTALQQMLTERYGFRSDHIVTLLGPKATKTTIIEALEDLQRTTAAGDFVLIYFSGHGTSRFDTTLDLPIDPSSGALVPDDARIYNGNAQRTLNGLLIGQRDIRPRLEKLDKDRQIVVIFDACFSGSSVRSFLGLRGDGKYLPLSSKSDLPDIDTQFVGVPTSPTPYTNLIYISASDRHERALDLRENRTTFEDRKPHGALTDALLVGLRGEADTNHRDGISYRELYNFVRHRVSELFGHTPQLLSPLSADLDRPLFGMGERNGQASLQKPTTTLGFGKVRIKIDGAGMQPLLDRLKKESEVTFSDKNYDIIVTRKGTSYPLVWRNGDLLVEETNIENIVTRIIRYSRGRILTELKNPRQAFNLWLQAGNSGGRTVFRNKEKLNVTLTSEADAQVLIMNIDPEGYMNILVAQVKQNQPPVVAAEGTVDPPFGVEYLKVFAFPPGTRTLPQFTAGEIVDPVKDANKMAQLHRLLQQDDSWAETSLHLVTVKGHD